jgi:hypothetical protein
MVIAAATFLAIADVAALLVLCLQRHRTAVDEVATLERVEVRKTLANALDIIDRLSLPKPEMVWREVRAREQSAASIARLYSRKHGELWLQPAFGGAFTDVATLAFHRDHLDGLEACA